MKKRKARRPKLPVGLRLDQRANAVELPLRMRTASLAAIAARSEKLAANNASMLRNEQRRIELLLGGSRHTSCVNSGRATRVQKELDDLAKAAQKNKLKVNA